MYINFWYPMATTEEVGEKPIKVRCLEQDFVVFRGDDGAAKCLSNTCVHRGGSLSGGKLHGNLIACPYHGWQYTGEGECKKIPSLGKDAKIPGRTRIDAYPVEERHGIVFAFLGDLPEEERPPIIPVPEEGQEGWRPTLLHFNITGNYERSIENGIDPAHNEYVHDTHGFSGEDEDYNVGELRDVPTEWGHGFWHTFQAPPLPPQLRELREKPGDLEVGTGHHGPNQVWTYIHPSPEFYFHQYLFERPIDEGHTCIYLLCMRNCMLDPDQDDVMNERNLYVVKQDVVIIENLHPVVTPDTNTKEFMTPSDKCIVMYRDRLKEWDAQGWRIDMDEVERNTGKVAYAIPSPARREQKGWVVDAVPMIDARQAAAKLKAAS